MRTIVSALFPTARAELLSALVLSPDREWFLSDLAKHLRVRPSTLQRELARLTAAGIITRRLDGKRVYYQADQNCPILSDLQGLFLKTSGLVDVIRTALRSLKKSIDVAVIFGSLARAEELSKSDVDLFLVGHLGLSDLTPALKRMEERLRREIQVFVYSPDEFRHKLQAQDPFLTRVLDGPLLSVIGEIHGYVETTRNKPDGQASSAERR